jgi:hypothetical protein
MQRNKLDMGKAWTQATGLIGSNRDTVSAVAGLFFFLPSFAGGVFVPDMAPPAGAGPSGADPEVAFRALIDQMTTLYADNWPLLVALTVVQFIGSMGLFALLTDRGNPTVGEALATGLKSIPTYILAQLISAAGIGLAIGIVLALLTLAAPAAATLAVVLTIPVMIYLFIKFALTAPVIAIEGERNPIKALARSWKLTKGNSFRIVLFLFLLMFTIGILAALVSGILGLVLSAFGEPVASIGIDLVGALVNALVTVIFLVVTVAIHRQLAGPSNGALTETFE